MDLFLLNTFPKTWKTDLGKRKSMEVFYLALYHVWMIFFFFMMFIQKSLALLGKIEPAVTPA